MQVYGRGGRERKGRGPLERWRGRVEEEGETNEFPETSKGIMRVCVEDGSRGGKEGGKIWSWHEEEEDWVEILQIHWIYSSPPCQLGAGRKSRKRAFLKSCPDCEILKASFLL